MRACVSVCEGWVHTINEVNWQLVSCLHAWLCRKEKKKKFNRTAVL